MENLNTIPTAEEMLIKEEILLKTIEESGHFPLNLTRDTHIGTAKSIKKAMIEFAKLHVEQALKEASKKVTCREETQYDEFDNAILIAKINRDSILNAYPLTLIK